MRLPFSPWSIAGVPSSQAFLGFLITSPPSVCVPAVIGALAVWIQNPQKNKKLQNNIHVSNAGVLQVAWFWAVVYLL